MRNVATLLVLVGFALAGSGAIAHDPPTGLKKVGDHWTVWDPPPAGPDHYIIQKDDTLWDLADKWFGDPFLWPQIWDENRYIQDSHWIYPGDPLVVPGRPTVVPDEGVPPVAGSTGTGEGEGGGDAARAMTGEDSGAGDASTTAAARPVTPPPPERFPAADASDLYCSGTIERDNEEPELSIVGRRSERVSLGQGNVVYLSRGRNTGVRAGDEFTIVRAHADVAHPATYEPMGTYVRRLGKVRVLIAHEETSTALIEMSCEDVYEGDRLIAWREIPVPMLTTMPRFDKLDPTPTGGPSGHIVWQRDSLTAFGAGDVIYTDLGRVSGAVPGDFIHLYRPGVRGQPRMNIGQAVILTVGPDTSTAKITYTIQESTIGDRVELYN